MKEEEIIENNKLIAEFMGYEQIIIPIDKWKYSGSNKPFPDHEIIRYGSITNNKDWFEEKDLKYHSDWNCLIPIIDKITSMDEYFKFKDYTSSMISEGGIYINTRFIENTWSDVVDFIIWYNGNK